MGNTLKKITDPNPMLVIRVNNNNINNNYNGNIENDYYNNDNFIYNQNHQTNNNNNNIGAYNRNNIKKDDKNFIKNILNICNKDKYNKSKYNKNNIKNCGICLQDYEDNEEILLLPCLHIYHYNCIIHWFERKKTCPFDNQNFDNYF